ncbi:MAG: glucose 1-dehydrogenase [Acidobacteriota bacterium]
MSGTASGEARTPKYDFRLDGKVALVTGASRGIGEAIARAFAAKGARVVLSSRKQDALDAVAASICDESGASSATAIACHAGQPAAIEALFERISEEVGPVSILVNNAATNPYFGPAVDAEEWAFDKTVGVNVKGYFLMAQRAARDMVQAGSGVILNVASINGLDAAPMQVIYSMTKAAVINLTQGLAKELGPGGVRVNAICPGLIETKFASALIEHETLYRQILDSTPLGRHGQPEDIAALALYLASDEAAFTTGAVMVCDGGATA